MPRPSRKGEVLALVREYPGLSSTGYALRIDLGKDGVQKYLRQLAADGEVHCVGRGTASRWYSGAGELPPEFADEVRTPYSEEPTVSYKTVRLTLVDVSGYRFTYFYTTLISKEKLDA